jgi:hypothetical protein
MRALFLDQRADIAPALALRRQDRSHDAALIAA